VTSEEIKALIMFERRKIRNFRGPKRKSDRPRKRCRDEAEEDSKIVGIRNW
jgi:hypothetical protein